MHQTYNPAGSPRVTDTTARPTAGDSRLERLDDSTRKLVDVPEEEAGADSRQTAERPVSSP